MLQVFNPKNESIKIWVNDGVYSRSEARVSVFDSVVQGGDAVWEGLRLYPEGILHLDRHLKRLHASAHALLFNNIPSEETIRKAIRETLAANNMTHDVHIRLTLTRGEKYTSSMDPRVNNKGCSLIVLAEWKPVVFDNKKGITGITSAIRRNSPQFLDSKIHHNNLLNNIQAKLQAMQANVDSALMLDNRGFAAEFHDVNLYAIFDNTLYTPFASACLPGITRNFVFELARKNNLPVQEADISLTQLYNADGIFTTGTMGELTPVIELDGRKIKHAAENKLFQQITDLYHQSIPKHCIKP